MAESCFPRREDSHTSSATYFGRFAKDYFLVPVISVFLDGLRPLILRPSADPVTGQITLSTSGEKREGAGGDRIFVPVFSLPVLQVVARLTGEFEIPGRFEAVEAKPNLIGTTARTAIDLVQARRSLRVEWYIVILIVLEIILSLYAMFFRPP